MENTHTLPRVRIPLAPIMALVSLLSFEGITGS